MSEDNKDKGSNQDKINALEAELEELKAQEKIKKLNNEIDSIKKNSPKEEKGEVKTFSKYLKPMNLTPIVLGFIAWLAGMSYFNSEKNASSSKPSSSFSRTIKLVPDVVTYKGKTYTASSICPAGETMRCQTIGFRRKLEELGCMTDKEHESYWRVAKQRQRERDSQNFQNSLKDLQRVLTPTTINCNSFGNNSGYNTTCTQY